MSGQKEYIGVLRMIDSIINEEWNTEEMWVGRATQFFLDNHNFFLILACLYLPMTFGGKYLMSFRSKGFELRGPLIFWNLFMTVFSAIGLALTLPPIITVWLNPANWGTDRSMTFHDGICIKWCYGDFTSIPAKAVFLFNISKVIEFIDTLFIILRKRDLIFLHYYHHLITFLFCWYMNLYAAKYNCGPYLFALMNYGVHTFMYFYYFLRSLNIKPPFDVAITVLQILQMVGGLAILRTMSNCPTYDFVGIVFGYSIYASFFLLFCRVFAQRYIFKPARKAPAGKKAPVQSGKGEQQKPDNNNGNNNNNNNKNKNKNKNKNNKNKKNQ